MLDVEATNIDNNVSSTYNMRVELSRWVMQLQDESTLLEQKFKRISSSIKYYLNYRNAL